ncbi:MAG: YggS family pyridoxal phosphate-dependent enzyme [Actinobacteria bacterium]|nr:YggS family pyridoxal phosphate-dependent enzyme [Actinomycetota bacterium]
MAELRRKQELALNLGEVKAAIPSQVTLIVVTKTFPLSDVEILYQLGERQFAENRDDEGREKSELMPNDSIWHFQGRVQSKKLRSIVKWSDFIHSLEDLDHAKKINEIAQELGKIQKVFLQINLDEDERDEGRSGIDAKEMFAYVEGLQLLSSVEILGLMGIAPLNRDPRLAFEKLAKLSEALQRLAPSATYISAGMSGDYRQALEFGTTHLRIGSSILGTRTGKA